MLEKVSVTLIGESPLLMHNGQLADPMNEWSRLIKDVTKRGKKKTDEDRDELRKLEWFGGLYIDADRRVAIPADNILGMIIEGAKKQRMKKQAEAGVFETEPFYRLEYTGPKDLDKLYLTKGFVDYRGVRVMGSRIMRSRPRFDQWKLPFSVAVQTDIIDTREVRSIIEVMGTQGGFCDYRPRFGRFRVE